MLSMILFGLFMVTVLLIAKVNQTSVLGLAKKEDTRETIFQKQRSNLNVIFSFARIVDSKFIGLLNFFFSNILTGSVNLMVNTLSVSDSSAFVIICIYSLASFGLPLIFFKFYNKI